jgi:hypothetical protein
MRWFALAAAMLCAAGLTACVGSPGAISTESPKQLKAERTPNLCMAYGFFQQEKVRAELTRRNALTPEEWSLVDAHSIEVGMSMCGMVAALGPPAETFHRVTATHDTYRYVYRLCSIYDLKQHRTVYVENRRITEIRGAD